MGLYPFLSSREKARVFGWFVAALLLLVGIDLIAILLHNLFGWTIREGPPMAIMIGSGLFSNFIIQFKTFWKFSDKAIPDRLPRRVQVFADRLNLGEVRLIRFGLKDVNAICKQSLVAISDGALEHLKDSEMDYLLGHEIAHFALRAQENKQRSVRPISAIVVIAIPILMAFRFKVSLWMLLGEALLIASLIPFLIKALGKSIWTGREAELACDYIGAKLAQSPEGAIECLKKMKHVTEKQQKAADYPTQALRIERIEDMIAGRPRVPSPDPRQEAAIQTILGRLASKP